MKVKKNQVLIFVVSLLLMGSLAAPSMLGQNAQPEQDDFYVEITQPGEGETVKTNDVEVEWNAEGSIELQGIVLDQNKDSAQLGPGTRNYTFNDVENGDHFVAVGIQNAQGDNRTDRVNFTVDAPDLSVEIDSPKDGDVIKTPDVTVQWTSQEVTYHEVRLDGEGWEEADSETSHTFEGLEEGQHSVEVKGVYDEEGVDISTTDNVSFEVNIDYPEIEIISPEDGQIFSENVVTVRWEATNTENHEIRLNARGWVEVGPRESYTFEGLEEDEYDVEVKGISEFDQDIQDTDKVSFTIDTVPPEIEMEAPEDGKVLTKNSVLVGWERSPTGTPIDAQWIRMDGGEWINLTRRETRFEFSDVEDGEHKIEIKVADEAGNENFAEVSFTVDTKAPELEIIAPNVDETAEINSDQVTVRWDGSDEGTGIEKYVVKIEHKDWVDVGTKTVYTFTGLIDGEYTVQIRASDALENTQVKDVSFKVDTPRQDLSIEIIDPEEGSTQEGSNLTVKWKSSGASYYEIRIDGGSWIEVGSATEYTFTNLPEDEYDITVRAVNAEGWRRTDKVSIELEEKAQVASTTLLGGSILTWILLAVVIANVAVISYVTLTKE